MSFKVIVAQIMIQLQVNSQMKESGGFRSNRDIYQASSKYSNMIPKTPTDFIDNNQLHHHKTNKQQEEHIAETSMDDYNDNQKFVYREIGVEDGVNNNCKGIEKQIDKEKYLKIYYCNGNGDNNNNTTFPGITNIDGDYSSYEAQIQAGSINSSLYESLKIQNLHTRLDGSSPYKQLTFEIYNQYPLLINNNKKTSDNIDRIEVQNILAEENEEAEGVTEDGNNSIARSTFGTGDLVTNESQTKSILNEPDIEKRKEDNVTPTKVPATPPKSLAEYVETQTIATTHVQNINQRHHLVKDLGDQILHGQPLNVHNLLDVAGSICAGPMGALCDMAAFSKLDCSSLGDLTEHTHNNPDFLAKKYYHPLYAHGVCRWPGCELPLDDMANFVKHLKTEHCLDDRSTAQARVQMQVVSQLEMHLQKERDRLQAMMHHLYLTKHFVMPEESQENISHIRYKNAIRSVSTTPDLNRSNNNSNDDSDGANDLQSFLMSSTNMSATRKRICDKSPLALAGGLPYMLERAGLDVQQEIQRNREFYKNADVRPPFTYASLIRQSIIESPDKQLTLNEIYNWFQNTFCYFRRNAATWKNAIRTNLSLHKCFVRYEDDFGSFWMVDDSEFVKRRHLSRGRPRGCGPSSSPNSNSQQFGNTITSTASNEAVDGSSVLNDTIANSPDSSTAVASSRQRCASSGSNMFNKSGNKNNGSENDGGNDDYDVCEVSRRSPAGCQTHLHSDGKEYCSSKQRPQLHGSIIGIAIKTNFNSIIDHNRMANRTNVGGGVMATGNNPGVGGIDDIGSVGSLDVDNHRNGTLNIANTSVETEDTNGYDFHTQSISNDAILNSPTGGKNNSGRYSPNMQNMWSIGSSLSDEVSSAEFSCINNDRYRNFVTGLHLQSLTQRHHFHQQKSSAHRVHPKTQQQQNNLRNNISNQQHDARPLHQTQGYHIYHATQEEHQKLLLEQQNQPAMGQDIFGVNAILSNTDKYFSHNIECRNDGGDTYKHQLFNTRQQAEQHLNISRQHPHATRSDISSDEVSNHIYIQHNGHEIDVKYTPPHKTIYNFETQNLNKPDVNHRNKRSADISFSNTNKTVNSKEEGSGIVDCDRDDIKRKRKKCHMSSMDYDDVEIKAEADSESELRNIDIPLRNKSY